MKALTYLIIFLFCAAPAFGQSLGFDPVSDIENLSGIQINDIKQDTLGFLWVGTNEGLYRYDGYKFKLYEPNSRIAGSSIINKIYFTRQGEMWVGTRGGLFKYYKNRDQFVTFRNDRRNARSINGNIINSIVEDYYGNIWIAISKGGVDLYDKKTNSFRHFLKADDSGLLSDDISDLLIDKENNLWISTWDDGLNKLDLTHAFNRIPKQAKFKSYTNPQKLPGKLAIRFIFEDPQSKELYIGTAGKGLLRYDNNSDSFSSTGIRELENCSLYDAYFTSDHKTWVSSDVGIKLVNLRTRAIENCSAPLCAFAGPVYTVFIDNQNITWLGSYKGLVKNVEKKIRHHRLNDKRNSYTDNIMALCKQGQYLWVGTWGDGLYLKDEQNGKSIKINADNPILKHVWDIKLVNDKWLLVATGEGLVRLNVLEKSFISYFKENNYSFEGSNFAAEISFTSFSKNTSGITWAGTWRGGLYEIDAERGEVKKYKKYSTEAHFVQAVHLDKKNQLWIGTVHSGLIRLSNLDGAVKSKIYAQQESPSLGLSSDYVSVIFEDNEERLWLGTGDGGINIIDPKTDTVSWIVKGDHNLPNNTIRAIIQDSPGDIWMSSKSGISKLDHHNIFINYTEDDGLEHMEFSPNAVMKDGPFLYFGNGKGYNVFNPSDLIFQKNPPKVFITDFKIFDKSITPGEVYEGGIILEKPINELESITLSYKIKNIAFEFSALNFTNPRREIFAYTLEGFNESWIYTNATNRYVSYSNLSPGDYVFKVKTARNNDAGEDQGRVIRIHIAPPIWQTSWFIVIAALVFILLLYSIHWMRLAGLRKQKMVFEKLAHERVKVIEIKNQQLERQNIEIQSQAAKLHEADQSKINFFANISHEFRTPLMLIVGPIARMLENDELTENESLTMIHRNSKRLLRLIDQIMDFSKIEAGSLTLESEQSDFIKFIKDITASFNYLAKVKKIAFEFHSAEEACFIYFDHDKLEKVVYNLLSNAFKVTPQGGRITVALEMLHGDVDNSFNAVRIEIYNTGKGINKEELPHLFTRFYRTKSYSDGTGIGLSLTKSLVELHGGQIEVKSDENEGTWFYVTIPVQKSGEANKIDQTDVELLSNGNSSKYVELQALKEGESVQTGRVGNPNAKTILILDDDDDMRFFISKLLAPFYNVIDAANGEEALKLACQFQPDLIVSDMMMPVMDGYQFLRVVKQDPNISHIPIILLTARASMDSRLKGLEEGADDYITKPFNEKILILRVKNLIERIQRAKERFSTDINLEPKEITITSLDEKFMQELLNIVDKNMANPHFGSDIICQELGVGRSYLYAKVKALTDLPVNEFVKTIRLKRAAVLLTKSQLHVNEVAYNVGFNDRYYFSRCFLKHFGISPTRYQKDNTPIT